MAYVGFKALANRTSPALAAYIGRKKYGKDAFQHAASTGTSLRNSPVNKGASAGLSPKPSAALPPAGPPKAGSARHKNALAALLGKG